MKPAHEMPAETRQHPQSVVLGVRHETRVIRRHERNAERQGRPTPGEAHTELRRGMHDSGRKGLELRLYAAP